VLFGILGAIAQAKQLTRSDKTEVDVEEAEEADEGAAEEILTSKQLRAIHDAADVDRDGKVSKSDLLDFHEHMRQISSIHDVHRTLGEMDSNQDGKLSYKELLEHVNQWGTDGNDEVKAFAGKKREQEKEKFKATDFDKNGILDRDELPAFVRPDVHEDMIQMTSRGLMKAKDKDGDHELSLQELTEGGDIKEWDLDFGKIDADQSGTLDMDEIMSWRSGTHESEEAMQKLFELADKDHDEMLTADELDNAKDLIAGSDVQYTLMQWAEHEFKHDEV